MGIRFEVNGLLCAFMSLVFCSMIVWSQDTADNTSVFQQKKNIFQKIFDKDRDKYILVGVGLTHVLYRDLATSPLYYKGWVPTFYIDRSAMGDDMEFHLNFFASTNSIGIKLFEIESVPRYTVISSYSNVSGYYAVLMKVKKLSGERLNFKAGGMASVSAFQRKNSSLQNNALGVDLFVGVFSCAKLTYKLGGWFPKTFILKQLFSKESTISYRVDIPLYWTYFRSDSYAYLSEEYSNILGSNPEKFTSNKYKGFQLRSRLDYQIPVNSRNGNKYMVSYVWQMYKTEYGGFPEQFSIGTNTLLISLMFNL